MGKLDCGCNWTGDKWETICLLHMTPLDLRAKVQALELQISELYKRIDDWRRNLMEEVKDRKEKERLIRGLTDALQHVVSELGNCSGKCRSTEHPKDCAYCYSELILREKRNDGLQLGESRNLPYPRPVTIQACGQGGCRRVNGHPGVCNVHG